jgi:hypothetical protein
MSSPSRINPLQLRKKELIAYIQQHVPTCYDVPHATTVKTMKQCIVKFRRSQRRPASSSHDIHQERFRSHRAMLERVVRKMSVGDLFLTYFHRAKRSSTYTDKLQLKGVLPLTQEFRTVIDGLNIIGHIDATNPEFRKLIKSYCKKLHHQAPYRTMLYKRSQADGKMYNLVHKLSLQPRKPFLPFLEDTPYYWQNQCVTTAYEFDGVRVKYTDAHPLIRSILNHRRKPTVLATHRISSADPRNITWRGKAFTPRGAVEMTIETTSHGYVKVKVVPPSSSAVQEEQLAYIKSTFILSVNHITLDSFFYPTNHPHFRRKHLPPALQTDLYVAMQLIHDMGMLCGAETCTLQDESEGVGGRVESLKLSRVLGLLRGAGYYASRGWIPNPENNPYYENSENSENLESRAEDIAQIKEDILYEMNDYNTLMHSPLISRNNGVRRDADYFQSDEDEDEDEDEDGSAKVQTLLKIVFPSTEWYASPHTRRVSSLSADQVYTLPYTNGDSYTGTWKNSKADGHGKMIYATQNAKYVGAWVQGEREGYGEFSTSDTGTSYKASYKGAWVQDKKEGNGKMHYANGDVYDGGWLKNSRSGKGRMRYKNDDVYDGDWHNNKKEGKGHMRYANGDVYDGKWLNNNRCGNGRMHYANGDVYDGKWNDNYSFGMGKMTYASHPTRAECEGSWGYGQLTKGACRYTDGREYEGGFVGDKRQGYGEMRYPNGDVYTGAWYEDLRDGGGALHHLATQQTDTGAWTADVLHGKGTRQTQQGGVEAVQWRHGVAEFVKRNGAWHAIVDQIEDV